MYAHGWDRIASELLQSRIGEEEIGKLLLEIAGHRLNLFASGGQRKYFYDIASFGSLILHYLDDLVSVATVYYTPPDI